MSFFSTEFSVKPNISTKKFAALGLAWLRGMKNSEVLDNRDEIDFDDDSVFLRSDSGETFSMKTVSIENGQAIGLRHEIDDVEGRIWRTEMFLRAKGSGLL